MDVVWDKGVTRLIVSAGRETMNALKDWDGRPPFHSGRSEEACTMRRSYGHNPHGPLIGPFDRRYPGLCSKCAHGDQLSSS